MDYKENANKLATKFISTNYGKRAWIWGKILPLFATILCFVAFYTTLININEPTNVDLVKSASFFIGGIVSLGVLCVTNMLFGMMIKDYADATQNEKK